MRQWASLPLCFHLPLTRIGVVAFSEWPEHYRSKDPSFEGWNGFSLSHHAWTIEVPYQRPKLYPEHPKTLAEHIKRKRILSGLTQKALVALLGTKGCTATKWYQWKIGGL